MDKSIIILLSIMAVVASPIAATPKINEIFIQPEEHHCDNEEYIEVLLPQGTTADYLKDFAFLIVDSSSILKYWDIKDMKMKHSDDVVDNNALVVISNNIATPNLVYHKHALTFRSSGVQCLILLRRPDDNQKLLFELKTAGSVYKLPRPATLTNQNRGLLQQLAVDMLVYQTHYIEIEMPTWVRQIISQWTGSVHILPTGDDEVLDRISLSRCGNSVMTGASFVHEFPTPGLINICNNERVNVQEDYLPEGYINLREERRRNGAHAEEVENTQMPQRHVSIENSVENYIGQLNALKLASKQFNDFFTTHPERHFYTFLPNTEDFQSSSIRCELCYQEHRDPVSSVPFVHKGSQSIPVIMQESGQTLSKRNPSDTWRKISQHQNLQFHKDVVSKLRRGSSRDQSNDVYEEIEAQEDLQLTADKIALVYLELKAGLSLNAHQVMSDGLNDIGFATGETLNSRYAATEIVRFLGKKIHENLINRLIASDTVFSIMLDSSTDVGSVHTMLVYIRFIEDGAPVTKVLQLTESHDSSANGMWGEIEHSIKSQGPLFEAFVKKNCVAMATDGASNMMGQYNSLKVKINRYLMSGPRQGRPFQHYHCANHKLALAYNDVMYSNDPTLAFCKTLTSHCNSLARFYSSKSYKRRDEMRILSESINEPIRAFRRIQKVRWVPATQLSYNAVVQNYRTFMTQLTSMTDSEREDTFTREAVINAIDLHDIFSDKNLLATLHLHMDVIFELTKWAKRLEKKDSTIIDLEEWHLDVRSAFENMKTMHGENLKTFLKSCTCSNVPCNTIEIYEASNSVVWKGVGLANHVGKSQIPKVSTTRHLLLDSLLSAFETRFPAEAISAFSVLLPSRLSNTNNAQWQKLGDYMMTYHGFDNSISADMIAMKDRLLRSQFYLTNNRDPPEIFWSNALSESDLSWSPILRKVINIALVQPSSTAQVESGFSLVAFIKNKYRTKLGTPIVEDTLRLKFNGPITKYLPKYRLALDWINSGHTKVDNVKRQKVDSQRMKRREFLKSMRF